MSSNGARSALAGRGWQLEVGPLSESDQVAIRELAQAALADDGVAPLSEVPLLQLGLTGPTLTHVIVRSKKIKLKPDEAAAAAPTPPVSGIDYGPMPQQQPNQSVSESVADFGFANETEVLGYAQVDRSGEFASAELVVLPSARRQGIGSALLKLAAADACTPAVAGAGSSPGKQLRIWAHGDLPAAQAFAAAHGYQPVRELLLLSKPLAPGTTFSPEVEFNPGGPSIIGHLAELENELAPNNNPGANFLLPPNYRWRQFEPGRDDFAWVQLNALAFADHPEQGRLTVADLKTRQGEAWFNPAHFHLVTTADQDELVAFNWLKVLPDQLPQGDAAASSGEIYAIGVHPAHRRRGLAAYLMNVGFAQLASVGLSQATLYVEGENEAALAAYYAAGFVPVAVDVQYAAGPSITKGE